jgi:hypothetical protein
VQANDLDCGTRQAQASSLDLLALYSHADLDRLPEAE